MALQRWAGNRYHGWIDPGLHPPPGFLDCPEDAPLAPGAELLLDCHGRQIVRLPLPVQAAMHSCVAYYFRNASFARSLRPSYAFQNLRLSERMRAHGIPTIEVLAALKRRGEVLNWHSFLVAREVLDVWELPASSKHAFQIHPVIAFSGQLASSLARELAAFHGHGFFHGDLKARHILVKRDPVRGFRFHLVDLEKAGYAPGLPRPLADLLVARDLIQLTTSLADQFDGSDCAEAKRFLVEEYLRAGWVSSARGQRIRRVLSLYSPRGDFHQGQTLFANLWRRVLRGARVRRDSSQGLP